MSEVHSDKDCISENWDYETRPIRKVDGEWFMEHISYGNLFFSIKYCPFCGKKLEEN